MWEWQGLGSRYHLLLFHLMYSLPSSSPLEQTLGHTWRISLHQPVCFDTQWSHFEDQWASHSWLEGRKEVMAVANLRSQVLGFKSIPKSKAVVSIIYLHSKLVCRYPITVTYLQSNLEHQDLDSIQFQYTETSSSSQEPVLGHSCRTPPNLLLC